MSRFSNLAGKPKVPAVIEGQSSDTRNDRLTIASTAITVSAKPGSRAGRKAIAAYFSLEMSLAMHVCARRNGLSLQALMAEAFNDVLRKYGQSPVD